MQCVQPCHSIGIWCSTATQDRSCAHVKVHGKSDASMPGPSGMRLLQTLSSTSLHCIPSDVLLTCVETDPPVPEPQIPSACTASQLLPQKLTISTRLISELCQRQNVFFADWPKPLRSRLVAYAAILKSCHDRNIVQFIGACLHPDCTIMVMEYLEGGDLYHAIANDSTGRFSWYRR